jgi:hypothetical protein
MRYGSRVAVDEESVNGHVVRDRERHERRDRHIRTSGLDARDVDGMQASSLRRSSLRQFPCVPQLAQAFAELATLTTDRGGKFRTPVNFGRSVCVARTRRHLVRATADSS